MENELVRVTSEHVYLMFLQFNQAGKSGSGGYSAAVSVSNSVSSASSANGHGGVGGAAQPSVTSSSAVAVSAAAVSSAAVAASALGRNYSPTPIQRPAHQSKCSLSYTFRGFFFKSGVITSLHKPRLQLINNNELIKTNPTTPNQWFGPWS